MVVISSARRMFCLLASLHRGRNTNVVSNLGLGLTFYNQATMLYALMQVKFHVWVVWEIRQRKCVHVRVRVRMHHIEVFYFYFLKYKNLNCTIKVCMWVW